MSPIRTLIIDDERIAREGIRSLLERDSEIEIAGECADGIEALKTIRAVRPDLIILDIQMPGLDGFGLLARLDPGTLPAIIFVTAYDAYAVRAFSVHAVDYILKPVEPERFASALEHAKKIIASREHAPNEARILALLAEIRRPPQTSGRIAVKLPGRIYFVETGKIDWIEAAGDYCVIHAEGGKHMIRESLRSLESMLDDRQFLRIHRSVIVRVDRIRELRPLYHGEFRILLADGSVQTISRSYRRRAEALLHLPS